MYTTNILTVNHEVDMADKYISAVGYGICIRTTALEKEKTVAYNELYSIGFNAEKELFLDIVRPEDPNRPEFERAIEELDSGDQIHIYSPETFLKGNNTKMLGLFEKAVKKGIDFLIMDFTGAWAKISPLSTVNANEATNRKATNETQEKAVQAMAEYIENGKRSRGGGNRKSNNRLDISDAFKEIYFAYESFQIDLPTTMALLSEYCGITNKVTFWRMALDFERTRDYFQELENYSYECFEILTLPKRVGGIPDDYIKIKEYLKTHHLETTRKDVRVNKAMDDLGIISEYKVFRRWELLEEGKPKPRKPVQINFNIAEFKRNHKPFQSK